MAIQFYNDLRVGNRPTQKHKAEIIAVGVVPRKTCQHQCLESPGAAEPRSRGQHAKSLLVPAARKAKETNIYHPDPGLNQASAFDSPTEMDVGTGPRDPLAEGGAINK